VLGIADATHAEYEATGTVIISPAACAVPPPPGTPRLDGRMPVRLAPGSEAARIYGAAEAREEFHCSFGLDPEYQPLFERGALRITGHGDAGEARVCELDGAAFYIGTLFMPQLAVTEREGHPLVDAFVRAAAARSA
jgi:CTP synthase (UTP-ammonia lyase)